jgi:hypothetical protein
MEALDLARGAPYAAVPPAPAVLARTQGLTGARSLAENAGIHTD